MRATVLMPHLNQVCCPRPLTYPVIQVPHADSSIQTPSVSISAPNQVQGFVSNQGRNTMLSLSPSPALQHAAQSRSSFR